MPAAHSPAGSQATPRCAGALIGQLMLVAIDDGGRSDLFLCLGRAGCVGGVRGVYDVDHDIG